MRIFFVIIIMFFSYVEQSFAFDFFDAKTAESSGIETIKCSTFNELPENEKGVTALMAVIWMNGFLSGKMDKIVDFNLSFYANGLFLLRDVCAYRQDATVYEVVIENYEFIFKSNSATE